MIDSSKINWRDKRQTDAWIKEGGVMEMRRKQLLDEMDAVLRAIEHPYRRAVIQRAILAIRDGVYPDLESDGA